MLQKNQIVPSGALIPGVVLNSFLPGLLHLKDVNFIITSEATRT